jgi:hypothetical protein
MELWADVTCDEEGLINVRISDVQISIFASCKGFISYFTCTFSKMILLDVSFGIFAFMPQGWLFMAFVIICECLVVSKFLIKQWYNRKIYLSVAGTNVISGLLGIITSLKLNGGWYLVVWFPWVSSNEIDIHKRGALKWLAIYYVITFILSLIVEIATNILFLSKEYPKNKIVNATIWANIITYLIGSILLYSFSFNLI